jgi:hypothetical protein
LKAIVTAAFPLKVAAMLIQSTTVLVVFVFVVRFRRRHWIIGATLIDAASRRRFLWTELGLGVRRITHSATRRTSSTESEGKWAQKTEEQPPNSGAASGATTSAQTRQQFGSDGGKRKDRIVSVRIDEIYGIVESILVQVDSAPEQEGILRLPARCYGIVVSRSEADQPSGRIV